MDLLQMKSDDDEAGLYDSKLHNATKSGWIERSAETQVRNEAKKL
jgi:hypothetical protein